MDHVNMAGRDIRILGRLHTSDISSARAHQLEFQPGARWDRRKGQQGPFATGQILPHTTPTSQPHYPCINPDQFNKYYIISLNAPTQRTK